MPSFNAIFGMKEKEPENVKPPFDRQAAFKKTRRSLQRQFFEKKFSRLHDTCATMLITEIDYVLSLFSNKREEYLRERAIKKQSVLKKNHEKLLARMAKERREEIKNAQTKKGGTK